MLRRSTHNVANGESRSLQDNGSVPVLAVETQGSDVFIALEGLGEVGLATHEEEHCGWLMAQVAIESDRVSGARVRECVRDDETECFDGPAKIVDEAFKS